MRREARMIPTCGFVLGTSQSPTTRSIDPTLKLMRRGTFDHLKYYLLMGAILLTPAALHTFGSPRGYAIRERSNWTTSMLSVFAGRAGRLTCMTGSTTWLRAPA